MNILKKIKSETQAAMSQWLAKRSITLPGVFSLADFPIGFVIKIHETFAGDSTKSMITSYNNCWIVRYTRPIIASGDLLVAETADIICQYVSYDNSKGRILSKTSVSSVVEVVA